MLFAVLAVSIFISSLIGAVDIPLSNEIVFDIRLPRIILGALIGILLSCSGAILQSVLKNPLSDPYILGVSSGAAVGAALAFSLSLFSFFIVPIFAFIGALAAVFLVYKVANVRGLISPQTLILSGVSVSMLLSAILTLIVLFGNSIYPIYFWLLGGLSGANWNIVLNILPYAVFGLVFSMIFEKELNILSLGDETAMSLGVNVGLLRSIFLIISSFMAAAAVSVSGIIGFVGLIIPHIVRIIFGSDNRILLPVSAILGAVFLILADTIARTIFSPIEIPVGIVTAFFGVPFFIYVLRNRKNA